MLIDQKFDILKMNTVPLKKTKHLVFHVMLVFRGVTQMKGDLLMTPSKVSYYSNNTLNNWRMDTKILPKSKEYAFSNAPFLDVHVTSDKNETPIAYSYDSILPRKLTCPLKGDYFNFTSSNEELRNSTRQAMGNRTLESQERKEGHGQQKWFSMVNLGENTTNYSYFELFRLDYRID